MKKISPVAVKLVFIGLIIGVLSIASCMIGSKMDERRYTYNDALDSISESAGGVFSVDGSFIGIPYTENYSTFEDNKWKTRTREGLKVVNLQTVKYNADLKSEIRNLGIYNAPIFTGELEINGCFNIPEFENDSSFTYYPEKTILIIPIKATSLMEKPMFEINKIKYESFYNSNVHKIMNDRDGIACRLQNIEPGIYNFSTVLKVRGSKRFMVNIDSAETKLYVKSDWNSPGFTGYEYLPDNREITDDGFTACWNVPFASENNKSSIGFDFIKSVNLYKKLDRAHNYAFLFIIVPFIVLFMFEIFASINLHPVHYLLSGAASIIFFLLLLSISEHLTFNIAYLIGAIASGILVSLYVMSITKKIKLGGIMSLMFVLLYGYLFFCLQSEDYALLMGSIFAFVILAGIMFITRKVNWSNLKKSDHTDLIKA